MLFEGDYIMKDNINVITINKFMSNYLGVKVDYSLKKWSHVRLFEILREKGLEECICNEHISAEDIYRGNVLCVKDQLGKIKFYKNPFLLKGFYQIDSFTLKKELEEKKKSLNKLMKTRIEALDKLAAHIDSIHNLKDEIESLQDYIRCVEAREIEIQMNSDSYNEMIKRKKMKKNDKYKRRR